MLRHTVRPIWLRLLLFGGIGLIVLGVGYTWYQQSRSKWEHSWLVGIPCRPPCWEGITPGQTNALEAEQLLRQVPEVGILNHDQPDTSPYKSVYWDNWANDYGGGSILYRRDTSVVFLVSLAFPHDFTLGEAIQSYGEPSHVLALAARNLEELDEIDYTLEIYWQSQGIVLSWAREYPPRRPVIDPNLKFHSVGFFESTVASLEQTVALGNPVHLNFLTPWKGFVDFREYCHAIDSGGGLDPQACETKQQ